MAKDIDATTPLRESTPPVAGPPSSQPKSRVNDPKQALEMIHKHETLRGGRLEVYRAVQDSYDRLPDMDPKYLEDQNLAWTSQVNWGSMEADIDSSISPLFTLGTQGRTYLKLEHDGNDDPKIPKFLKILEQEDKRMLDRWDQWAPEYMQMLFNMKAFGLGAFHFDSPKGWTFNHVHPGNLIYPQSATINVDKLPWLAIKTQFEVSDLILKLKFSEKASEMGWNPEAVRDAIRTVAKGDMRSMVNSIDHGTAESVVQGIYENDIYMAERAAEHTAIDGFILYVREHAEDEATQGQWSEHYLVTAKRGEQGSPTAMYMYSGIRKHRKLSDVLSIFPDTVSQGLLERLRGVGVKMLPYHYIRNRLWNQAIDVTWLTSSLILQGDGGDDLDKVQEISFGPITMIPSDIDIPQQQIRNTAEGLIALIRETDALESGNSQAFGSSKEGAKSNKTLGEARLYFQQDTRLELFQIAFHRHWLGKFHRTRFMRAIDPDIQPHDGGYAEAKDLKKRAKRRGVEASVYKKIDWVEAAVVFGDGNPANQYLALSDLLPLRGDMSSDGRRQFARDVMEALTNSPERADAYLGPDGLVGDVESEQRRIAQLENGHFQTSDAALIPSRTDNHLIHLGEHTIFVTNMITLMEQGQVGQSEVYALLGRAMSHVGMNEEGRVTGGHFQEFAQDPQAVESGAYDEFVRQWTGYINTHRELKQQLQAQQLKAQYQQLEELRNPSLTVDEQNKRLETQSKLEREDAEFAAKMTRDQEKHDMEMAVLNEKRVASQQKRLTGDLL